MRISDEVLKSIVVKILFFAKNGRGRFKIIDIEAYECDKTEKVVWGCKMITSIKEMHNLGRYENFNGSQEIGKQQIIFGFNGSGKSTLSDVFYSLANKTAISVERRTLDKITGEKAGEISIKLGTESEDITYSESNN